ncbi:unnamed protein product, partial [Cladocopium goreaui]
ADEDDHRRLMQHFAEAARTFQKENEGNARAFVAWSAAMLRNMGTWAIQFFAAAVEGLRSSMGGDNLWIAMSFNVLLLLLARLIVRRDDAAQGSGYPQMKAMFFGNTMLSDHVLEKNASLEKVKFLSAETLSCKALGLALVVAAGMPIGQEGPNVHMAACISRHLRPKFFEKNLPPGRNECSAARSETVVQILHAACAAGVAATFSSLLGGVLLSLDARDALGFASSRCSMGRFRWGDFPRFSSDVLGVLGGSNRGENGKTCHKLHLQELMLPQIYTFQVYWGCFLAAVCGAVTTIVINSSCPTLPHLLTSDVLPLEGVPRHHPLLCCAGYMLIGVVFGVLGGLFNLAHDQVIRCCRSQPVLLNTLFSKEFFQGNEVNSSEVHMLLLALLVKAITTLFASWRGFRALSMPTPTGVVAPALVLGALLMRCFTSLVPERCFVPFLGTDSPSELDAFEARLAILGASAFGCGVVRAYGIAITVFEVLSLNEMVVPLSLSSLTAVVVADFISLPFFDTALVRRGWHGVSKLTCTDHGEEPAFMVMQPYSDFPSVPELARLEDLDDALNAQPPQLNFPVVGTDDFLLQHHPHHRTLRGAVTRHSLQELRRVRLLTQRWEESSELLCDPCPLVLDPLFTVQELYITLKVARKDMAYITGKGVLLGRVGFKELIGEGMPIAKGLGAYHDKVPGPPWAGPTGWVAV